MLHLRSGCASGRALERRRTISKKIAYNRVPITARSPHLSLLSPSTASPSLLPNPYIFVINAHSHLARARLRGRRFVLVRELHSSRSLQFHPPQPIYAVSSRGRGLLAHVRRRLVSSGSHLGLRTPQSVAKQTRCGNVLREGMGCWVVLPVNRSSNKPAPIPRCILPRCLARSTTRHAHELNLSHSIGPCLKNARAAPRCWPRRHSTGWPLRALGGFQSATPADSSGWRLFPRTSAHRRWMAMPPFSHRDDMCPNRPTTAAYPAIDTR